MIRRQPVNALRAFVTLTAIAAIGGCAGSGGAVGNDVVAKVNDQTLTFDQLEAPTNPAQPAFADGEAVRAETTTWVQDQLINGIGLDATYETAFADYGILCPDVIATPGADEAVIADFVDQVEAGGWDAVDPNARSNFPCQTLDGAPDDLVQGLAPLSPGEYAAFDDPAVGFAIIRIRPFEDLDKGSFLQVLAQSSPEAVDGLIAAIDDIDVYVNPRVGTFSSESQTVEPIG